MKIPDFLLDQWLGQYKFRENPPEFDLASSTGPHWTARELLGLLTAGEREQLFETALVYSNTSGKEELRAGIGEMQGVGAERVLVTTGAEEALLILFFLAAEPGANVILPFPLFPPTAVIPQMLGIEARFYRLRRENNFGIDLDEVKKLADGNTKLLFVNSPHNPTGATISDEEMRELHDFAVERGIQFVSDEVYHPIYHGRETASAARLPHATVLGSFSKSLSLSGLRLGWIVERDEARMHSYTDARSYFTISNTPLAEELAAVALRHRETIFARAQQVASTNLALLEQFFAEHAERLSWVRPRGGMTAFPWLTDGANAREFCRRVAERGVLLAPGDCWEMPDHFRLGFGVSDEWFAEGLHRLGESLREREHTAASLSGTSATAA